jgi:hypothetical protein
MGHTKKIFLKTVPEIVHNNLNRVFYFSERENHLMIFLKLLSYYTGALKKFFKPHCVKVFKNSLYFQSLVCIDVCFHF